MGAARQEPRTHGSVAVEEAVQRILTDKPAFHGHGQMRWDVSPGTLALLARYATGAERTLEIGCGVSTVVFAAAATHHVAVSPSPGELRRFLD